MCNGCKAQPLAIRQDRLSPAEVAKFKRLRHVDPRKLAAMLPTWVKAHQRAVMPPRRFVFQPNQPPHFPAWTNRKWNAATAAPQAFQFPGGHTDDLVAYVREFDRLNGLKSSTITTGA